jgi:uncharacterized protein YbjT (DUF2867 family)
MEVAYYLVHSMGSGAAFEKEDRRAATVFAEAARREGLRRIIYLGGLGSGPDLSPHLASRQETGRILRESGVPATEFRASIIVGSGSLSFEMIRALVERLPVMVTPRWVDTTAQPIAIEDVIAYLVAAAHAPSEGTHLFEIGGADRTSYGGLMREYARQRGLKRRMIPVPVLTPGLSSLWLGLVTPLYASIGRHLVDGLRNETVVGDDRALRAFDIRPRGYREAIERALLFEDRAFSMTRWCDAFSSSGSSSRGGHRAYGTRIVDSRAVRVAVASREAFAPVERIGGGSGWYFADWLWRIRGFLDLLARGPGLRRGRRDPVRLAVGDTVDFWRVEAIEADRLLRLAAEMRLPGRAWLQFEIERTDGGSLIRQTAIFDPLGLLGRIYWYALYPIHAVVFRGMLRELARRAERRPGDAAR